MKLSGKDAGFFVPDGASEERAFDRATHLAVGAHQDDLEIMAWHGILNCFRSDQDWFLGVTVTDGAGSPRAGIYGTTSNEEMAAIRRFEQRKAAVAGEYSAVIQLAHTSARVKDAADPAVYSEIKTILERARPRVLYTHNPADKHDTHVAVALRTIKAVRELPREARPERILGCEVWRGLDWMLDEEKQALDVSDNENLAASILGIYDSQISGGKRYDLATLGRWRSNATYFASHDTDKTSALIYAMDLTPLGQDEKLDISEYVRGFISRFGAEVDARLSKLGGSR